MDVQPITYRGRVVAACTAECFLLADDLAYRPSGDPELVFVVMMCASASDIARGLLPGPYGKDQSGPRDNASSKRPGGASSTTASTAPAWRP